MKQPLFSNYQPAAASSVAPPAQDPQSGEPGTNSEVGGEKFRSPVRNSQVTDSLATMPVEKATFWQRWWALFIDNILLSFAIFLLDIAGGLITVFSEDGSPGRLNELPAIAQSLFQIAIPFIYFAWAYSTGGQTIGKKMMGIKVVSIDGSPLNLQNGILRSLGYIPSGFLLGLGFLWSIWDPDKQAWHDKITGTCVVKASVAREQLLGSIDPQVAQRRQRRWLIGLVILSILGVSLYMSFMRITMAEVRAMEPWPGKDVSPESIARIDLSHLGLELDEARDAHDEESWAGGNYEAGSFITYKTKSDLGDTPGVAIWVLRYKNKQDCANDFQNAVAWANNSCGMSKYANLGGTGIIHCIGGNGYNKILMNDGWIVDIWAFGEDQAQAAMLVASVQNTLAENWKSIDAP